jgi:hypothetical protein
MKKLSLFLLGFVATSFMASAQVSPDMFIAPANTGANMTVGVNASKFDQFEGGQIGAFIDLNGDGALQCVGLENIAPGFFGLALWGDDSSTPDADGLGSSAVPQFAILHEGNVIMVAEIPQFTGYVTNGIVNITDATLSMDGCDDPGACNYTPVNYSDVVINSVCEGLVGCMDAAYFEYNSLATCDPNGDCSVLIIPGCTDDNFCNYSPAANSDDGSCLGYFGCTDSDFIEFDSGASCDDLTCSVLVVLGCTDASAFNFNSAANVDDNSCVAIELGCTDETAFNYNSEANTDDGSCMAVVVGCTNPAACNFMADANTDSGTGESCDDLGCFIDGVNFTPVSDEENTSIIVTSNNMSVLFPVNNAGLWNNDQSNIEVGDYIAAVYTTSLLENDFLAYSEISGVQNAGSALWTGDQTGLAVFGEDNMINNGFTAGEDLKWLVKKADGTVLSATVTYATPAYDGTYQEGTYVTVNSVITGSPFYDGCTDAGFMEYNPLALNDDGSCSTFISVGCLDANFVNYAGADVDADNIHDNSENFGDAFGQNYNINLNTGSESPSGVGAIFHDVDVCQTQVPGCTYPYAANYSSDATEDDGSCDWSAYSHYAYSDVTGVVGQTLYSFGGDDNDSNNDWVGSDFEYANDLYQDARMGTGHIVTDLISSYDAYTERRKADSTFLSDTLIDVAAWFAADEAADAQELADTMNDNYARFDAMHTYLSDSISATLDSAALAFAADEAADLQELTDTMNDNYARFDAMHTYLSDSITATLDSAAAAFAADEAADAQELADSIADGQARYDYFRTVMTGSADGSIDYDLTDAHYTSDLDEDHGTIGHLQDALNYHAEALVIDLGTGWNTVAYYLHHESSVVAQFENQFGSETAVQENINIVKNNEGLFYWPDFLFDGLGMLEPGQGYQVRVKDATSGKSDFVFDDSIAPGENRILNPTVPSWALDMEVENHPNDIRTLVRVVNMLGQEVVPAEQFAGEVLLYLFNDSMVS